MVRAFALALLLAGFGADVGGARELRRDSAVDPRIAALAGPSFATLLPPRSAPVLAELEQDLGSGTTNLLRSTRKKLRQIGKVIRAALGRWSEWLGGLILAAFLTIAAGIVDSAMLATWQRAGLRAFARAFMLSAAVFIRLLREGKVGLSGKLLLGFGLAYAAAPGDLLPDSHGWMSWFDDACLLVWASKTFMASCPDDVVLEHARAAATGLERAGGATTV